MVAKNYRGVKIMRFEITIKNKKYLYDAEEIWEKITFDLDMIDTILGYGTVYRYVSFGDVPLKDGRWEDIMDQVKNLEDNVIYNVMQGE